MTDQPTEPQPTPDLDATVSLIAGQLGETEEAPVAQIRRIVKRLGVAETLAFLERTKEVEQGGGMLLPDNTRRRTPGGVFFALVRKHLPKKERAAIFAYPRFDKKSGLPPNSPLTPPPPEILRELLADMATWQRGQAGTVKITLVGRPGPVQQNGRPGMTPEFVAFPMEGSKVPTLPKGMPAPHGPTRYLVLVAGKQWRKVADTIARHHNDKLIVEGFCALDPRVPDMITVRTNNITTVETQRAQREAQQKAAEAKASEPKAADV
ncbi:MAG TPA: phosphorylated adapter RNA export RNA-binding domain-containing protein [Roseiflexaceae bacterium]|nr:phosphorylated adapter RNA export RNA-binding domain-containing protein [Roseiflexaceae bacterium]